MSAVHSLAQVSTTRGLQAGVQLLLGAESVRGVERVRTDIPNHESSRCLDEKERAIGHAPHRGPLATRARHVIASLIGRLILIEQIESDLLSRRPQFQPDGSRLHRGKHKAWPCVPRLGDLTPTGVHPDQNKLQRANLRCAGLAAIPCSRSLSDAGCVQFQKSSTAIDDCRWVNPGGGYGVDVVVGIPSPPPGVQAEKPIPRSANTPP